MTRVHRTLAFRALMPVVVLGLGLVLLAIGFARFTVTRFVEQRATNDLRWRSFAVHHLIDSSLDALQREGKLDDEIAVRERKVDALMAVEDFARVNELKVTVHQIPEERTVEVGIDLPAKGAASHSIPEWFSGDVRRFTYAFRFEPWRWEVNLTQDTRAYLALLDDLYLGAGISTLVFVAGIIAFMCYLSGVTGRPIRRIIQDLEGDRPPTYEGIAEFEYLGQSISKMMGERKAAEERIRDLYHEAQRAVRLRDEFLMVASHELRTPVTSLRLSLQTLQRAERMSEKDAEVMSRSVGLAARQGERLNRLVDDLLDVSRIETGQLPLDLGDVELGAIVRDVVERFEVDLSRAGCPVAIQGDGAISGRWDRSRIDQVVTNLLSNAVKFGAGKPIEILFGEQAGTAWLTVRDHGIGIEKAQQAPVFERFARAVSTENYGGLGLGLYISRRVVEAHGGRLRVDSQPGSGSSFTVELPRAEPGSGERKE
jgi:signal transduction histidine kinase